MCMPMYPEIAENAAPSANAIAVFAPRTRLPAPRATANTTAKMAAMIAIVVYCRFMNARAPSRIALPIRCMSSFPGGSERTSRARYAAVPIAARPAMGTMIVRSTIQTLGGAKRAPLFRLSRRVRRRTCGTGPRGPGGGA